MATKKKVTAKEGEQFIAMLGGERTGKKTTGYATEMRRCTSSARFGIEPHEAPVSTFPKQPSRKDGLGTMCAEHWKAYVKGLTADRKARAASGETPAPAKATTKRERRRTPMAHLPEEEARKVPSRTSRLAARNRAKPSPKVAEAEALIAEVDALPGPEHVQRVGDDDVQAALETVANGGTGETPLGEAIDGGSEEADAA